MNIQMILIYNTETDSKTDFMVASREGWRGKTFRECGIDMYTLLYLKCKTNKVILYSTGTQLNILFTI